eukprot:363911-Chlamydomonas_euryale.AAC.3
MLRGRAAWKGSSLSRLSFTPYVLFPLLPQSPNQATAKLRGQKDEAPRMHIMHWHQQPGGVNPGQTEPCGIPVVVRPTLSHQGTVFAVKTLLKDRCTAAPASTVLRGKTWPHLLNAPVAQSFLGLGMPWANTKRASSVQRVVEGARRRLASTGASRHATALACRGRGGGAAQAR